MEKKNNENLLLCCRTEHAYFRIIPYIEKAILHDIKRPFTYSNYTDVVMYLLSYVHHFKDLGIKELWIILGTGD